MKYFISIFTSLVVNTSILTQASGQWTPSGNLLNVPVINQCARTASNVASATADGLYFCPTRAAEIDRQVPDASHFYLVHEYGRLAIQKTSRNLADCWAAHMLATAPNGPHYVRQWIKHWQIYGTSDPANGAVEQRIANVRRCCACGL